MLWVLQSSWFWPSNRRSKRPKPSYYEDSPIRGRWQKRWDVCDVFLVLICIVYCILKCLIENMWTNLLPVYLCLLLMINIFWTTRLYINRIVNMMLARNIFCVTVKYLPFQTPFAFLFSNVVWIFLSGQGFCWSITPLSNWKTVPPCVELPWAQTNSITSFCVDGVEKNKS